MYYPKGISRLFCRKMYGPQSDDTVILYTSDEEKHESAHDTDALDVEQFHFEEKKRKMHHGIDQLGAEDELIKRNETKRMKPGLEHQVESDMELSEHGKLHLERLESSNSEEDAEVKEIFGCAQQEPANTNIVAEDKTDELHVGELKEIAVENSDFL